MATICRKFGLTLLVLLAGGGVTLGAAPKTAAPMRILSLSAEANDLLVRIGARDRLAAIEHYGTVVPGVSGVPVVGRGSMIAIEKLVELQINTAILWYYQSELEAVLKRRNIQVVSMPPPRLDNYAAVVRRLGRLTGCEAAADKLAEEFERAVRQLRATAPMQRRPVYFELYSPGCAVGTDSYLGEIIRLAGGYGVGAGRNGTISAETVAAAAPEVIFYVRGFAEAEDFSRRRGFAAVPAVKNRRVYPIDRELLIEGVGILKLTETLKKYITD